MVKSCVFFAVRTELLNIIHTTFGFKWLKSLSESVDIKCKDLVEHRGLSLKAVAACIMYNEKY
jgi:hypothetical protein